MNSRKDFTSPADIGVSVVIPCFNDGDFLVETIKSISEIKITPLEIIVVNDGSNDPNTLDILANLDSKKIRTIHTENNGPGVARNIGISEARMPLILPVDSDNIVYPEYFFKAVPIFANTPDVDIVYAGSQHFGLRDEVHRAIPFNRFRLFKENYIDTCAFFRKSLWEKVGGFDPAMRDGLEDWEFWISAMANGARFQHLDIIGFAYRVRSGSRSDYLNSARGRDTYHELKIYMFQKHVMLMKEHYDIMFNSHEKLEKTKSLLQVKRIKKLLSGLRGPHLRNRQ